MSAITNELRHTIPTWGFEKGFNKITFDRTKQFSFSAKKNSSPVYTNNRGHLGHPEHVTRITPGLQSLMMEGKELKDIDGILGIATAGLPWASIIAKNLHKRLFTSIDGTLYEFKLSYDEHPLHTFFNMHTGIDHIASDISAIPHGASLAYKHHLPFSYIRKQNKKHGLTQTIEGGNDQCKNALVVYTGGIQSYLESMRQALIAENKYPKHVFQCDPLSMTLLDVNHAQKLKIVVMEDTISTGASSLKIIDECQSIGMIIKDIIAIFQYCFPGTKEKFDERNVTVKSLTDFSNFIHVAFQKKLINENEMRLLHTWRDNPEGWNV